MCPLCGRAVLPSAEGHTAHLHEAAHGLLADGGDVLQRQVVRPQPLDHVRDARARLHGESGPGHKACDRCPLARQRCAAAQLQSHVHLASEQCLTPAQKSNKLMMWDHVAFVVLFTGNSMERGGSPNAAPAPAPGR